MKLYTIEVSDKTLDYILTGLELYCINLNNAYGIMHVDIDVRDNAYADVFYTYHYFLTMSDVARTRITLKKPYITKKTKSEYIKLLDKLYYKREYEQEENIS